MIKDIDLDENLKTGMFYRITFKNKKSTFSRTTVRNRFHVATTDLTEMYNVANYNVRVLPEESYYQIDIKFGGETGLKVKDLIDHYERETQYLGVDLEMTNIVILEEEDEPSIADNWWNKFNMTDVNNQLEKYANIVIFILFLILLIRITELFNR